MSFYKGSINYGEQLWPPQETNGSDFLDAFYEHILTEFDLMECGQKYVGRLMGMGMKRHSIFDSEVSNVAAACKFWSEDVDESKILGINDVFDSAWSAALPGKIIRRFFTGFLYNKLTPELMELIRRRRDVESPLTEAGKIERVETRSLEKAVIYAAHEWLGLEKGCAIEKRVMKDMDSTPNTVSILMHHLFVTLPHQVPSMDPATADYDDMLRFCHALYSVAVQDRITEWSFEDDLMKPLNEHYAADITDVSGNVIPYSLWSLSKDLYDNKTDEDLFKIQMALMGNTGNEEMGNKIPWSFNQIVDVATLFNYIDPIKGSWIWLDFIMSTSVPIIDFDRRRRITTEMRRKKTDVIYAISKKTVRELLSKTTPEKFLSLFKSNKLYFHPTETVHAVFDCCKRVTGEKVDVLQEGIEIVYKTLYNLPVYDYLDSCDEKTALMRSDIREALDVVGDEIIDGSKGLKKWLRGGEKKETKVQITNSENQNAISIYVETSCHVRPLEAVFCESFIYETMAGVSVPKKGRLARLGRLFAIENEKERKDEFYTSALMKSSGIIAKRDNLYEEFHTACCDYYCHETNKNFDDVWRETFSKSDRHESFINIYARLCWEFTTDHAMDVIKSVTTFVGGPSLGYGMIMAIGGNVDQEEDFSESFMEILLECCDGYMAAENWVREKYARGAMLALPGLLDSRDLIYPRHVLRKWRES